MNHLENHRRGNQSWIGKSFEEQGLLYCRLTYSPDYQPADFISPHFKNRLIRTFRKLMMAV
jgi:hypothetical protein